MESGLYDAMSDREWIAVCERTAVKVLQRRKVIAGSEFRYIAAICG